MIRRRLLGICLGIAVAALCWPAAALAGTFTWSLPADFTASAGGANPDHDSYGATPWSYVEGAASSSPLSPRSHDPSGFTRLPAFTTSRGGVTGWTDPSAANALVGANATAAAVSDGTDTFPPGQMVLTPAADRLVAIGWTSPLARDATVQVSGSVAGADPSVCPLNPVVWTLDQNGTPLASGFAGVPVSASPTVSPGGAIYLTIDHAGGYDPECDTATLTLRITATETSGPSVTLSSPADGSMISGGQPVFAGRASTAFGTAKTVHVRIYSGGAASGTPLQSLDATPSGDGSFSVAANASLPDGRYTAQAEQDDLASPPDRGLSQPVTFVIHNSTPAVTLNPPSSEPVTTATPTFTGRASTAAGDGQVVTLKIYAGSGTTGTALRSNQGHVDSSGRFSIKVTPGLTDGTYTAVAVQPGSGGTGLSRAVTFRIQGGLGVGGGGVIGPRVSLSSSGMVAITVTCPSAAPSGCAGYVLVLTQRSYRPSAGGPAGRLRVLFAYVRLGSGRTVTLKRRLTADLAAFLRHARSVRVKVTATLNAGSRSTATRTLTFA